MVEVLNKIAADIANEGNDKVRSITSSFNEFTAQLKEVASKPAENDPENKREQYLAVIEYKINEIRIWLEQDNRLTAYEVVKTHLKALDAAVNNFRAITEVDVTPYGKALDGIEELYGKDIEFMEITDSERPDWVKRFLVAGGFVTVAAVTLWVNTCSRDKSPADKSLPSANSR